MGNQLLLEGFSIVHVAYSEFAGMALRLYRVKYDFVQQKYKGLYFLVMFFLSSTEYVYSYLFLW